MDNKNLWQTVLSDIELTVSRGAYLAFFSKTELVSVLKNVVTINCTNPYISSMLEERYYSLLSSALSKQLKNEKISLIFTTTPRVDKEDGKIEMGPLFNNEERTNRRVYSPALREDFTFDNFAVSGSNQLAYAAAEAVAKQPGTAYNPFFIWGGVGVGKTHLMHAVGHEIYKKTPEIKIIYCTGEDFTNEIVFAIREKKTPFFKNKFRSAKLLLIDDVQFIAGRETVQEEFFHTFNAILGSGGQIILTSDRPPSEIAKLEDRLRSRFEGGMTVDISPPDFELRTAILLIKARAKGKDIPIEAAKVLAANVTDTRKLEGTLTKFIAISEIKKIPMNVELAEEVIGEKPRESRKQTTHSEIMGAVCAYFDLKPTSLRGEKRDRPIVFPRQILMYILKKELNMPYTEIGEVLGGRDHTTIMHGVEKISGLLPNSEKLRKDLENIKRKVWG